jgi:endonuclease/exonuclease/phosphatase family metal-dependent hydrolase
MRIVTLNTWKNEGDYRRRLGLMCEGLAALSPDVVCLQEAFVAQGLDTAQTLAAHLGLAVHAAPARLKPRNHESRLVDSTSGLAVLSRWPSISASLPLPSDPADGERIAQRLDIRVGDRHLRVLNLHLTHLRDADALRGDQLAHALAWASEGLAGGLVVAGDLNATAAAVALAPLGLPPRAGTLHGGRLGVVPTTRAIDHCVLLRPGGWREVVQFRGLENPDAEGWFPSDHACVGVDLAENG